MAETADKFVGVRPGAAPSVADLEKIMAFLSKTWGDARPGGGRACDPCRSGLDRFVIEDPAFRGFAR
jgi:hypothetical protein